MIVAPYTLYFNKTGGKVFIFYLKKAYFTKTYPNNCIQIKNQAF